MNGPSASRAEMIDSIAPWPTFLTASSPNRMASSSTVNSTWLRPDGRRPDLDAEPAALRDRRGDLLLVVPERREDGRHVVDGEVRLEVRGLVGDQAIARGVGLVEPIPLERLEGREDLVDDGGRHAALRRAGDELLLLGPQDARLLLPDRVAERVGLRTGEAAEGHGRGHDVLLVDEDPVRPLQERLEQRMQVRHRLLAVLPADVGRDVVHRPGAVERDHRREVEDRRRAELADVAPHAGRLELEDAGRLARAQELERLRVVERDVVEVDVDPAVGLDQVDGVLQDREVREAQEVELQEAQRLDGVHLVLRHQRVRVGRLLERHQLRQGLAGDDDPGGVGGRVAGDTLELLGEVDQPLDVRIRVVLLAELRRRLERLLQPDPELVRDGLRDPVDVAVGVTQHPPDVADGGAGEHRAEGDDLGDVILAVLPRDVGDDLVAPVVLEVDVDVRHRHPVGVEEALERQAVGDRVDRGDAEGVRDDRARRAAPAGRLDPLLPCEPDEVGHDQEVAGVAHRGDDTELVLEALQQLRGRRAVPPFEAAPALLREP